MYTQHELLKINYSTLIFRKLNKNHKTKKNMYRLNRKLVNNPEKFCLRIFQLN